MLASRQELTAFREACKAALNAQKIRILVCAGTGCVAGGSLDVYQRLIDICKEKQLPVSIELEEEVEHESIGIKKGTAISLYERAAATDSARWVLW